MLLLLFCLGIAPRFQLLKKSVSLLNLTNDEALPATCILEAWRAQSLHIEKSGFSWGLSGSPSWSVGQLIKKEATITSLPCQRNLLAPFTGNLEESKGANAPPSKACTNSISDQHFIGPRWTPNTSILCSKCDAQGVTLYPLIRSTRSNMILNDAKYCYFCCYFIRQMKANTLTRFPFWIHSTDWTSAGVGTCGSVKTPGW